jgi:hypothetical protein
MTDQEMDAAESALICRYLDLKRRRLEIEDKFSKLKLIFEQLPFYLDGFIPSHPEMIEYPSAPDLRSLIELHGNIVQDMDIALRQMKDAGINLS